VRTAEAKPGSNFFIRGPIATLDGPVNDVTKNLSVKED